jgi:pimeloyl-ACP methyl ester carboxylesterase
MHVGKRKSSGMLITVGVVLLSLLSAGLQPTVAVASASTINWSPCHRQLGFPFECGTLQVPLDYDGPSDATISIAVVRLPATDPAQRIGSLFLNPGGPGGSGFDFALSAGPFLYTEEVRAKFDIVGFDPRGIFRSTALRCFGNPRQWEPYSTPFAFPLTPEEEAQWEAADRFLTDACRQRGGTIIDHMATANVARDLDRLRAAVGDEQLTYAGYSYGSFLGVTYANLFPDRVRALVVDGVLDPVAWTTGTGDQAETVPTSTRLRSDQGAQATLDEFFRLCDLGGAERCAFAPASAERFAALAELLRQAPIPIVDPVSGAVFELNYSTLIATALISMYDSFSWPFFAELLANIEAQASPEQLGAALDSILTRVDYITKRAFPRYRNEIEGGPGVACSESDNPDSYRAWSTQGAEADEQFGYFGRIWTWTSSVCLTWPGADADRYTGPFTANTANPVLVVGNSFDPATRYQGAVTVAGLLPNSRLLTVHAWGHVSVFLSQCADNTVAAYLLTTVPPPPGTVCEQEQVPFTGTAPLAAAEIADTPRARTRGALSPLPTLSRPTVTSQTDGSGRVKLR